ncbi:MAG: M61 family metallopeptidase [Nitriliruptoraceae bacterium]|nr:M61 family metallopeptidase [Nitriliruptoraceae bacterium]
MADPIRYDVDLTDRLHHLVRVTVHVPADLSPGGEVVLSVWTPGSYVVRDYVHHVQWIRALDAQGAEVALTPSGGTAWTLPATADGPVAVTLELYANDLTVRTNHVDDHHALLIPAATFPFVRGGEDRTHLVHLPPSPAGHVVHSLLPAAGPDEPDTYLAAHRDHLIDSAFEVGALPTIDFEVADVPHRFVWAGHGGAPDLARIARDTTAIADAAIDLFDVGLPTERYTILCVGADEGGGGLEHRDGTVLQMPVRTFQDDALYARFQSLVAHEYLHLWNVKRLVPAALVQPVYEAPTRSESLWVAEGWTAYYDELLPTRAGIWTPRQLLDTLGATHQRVTEDPGHRLQSLRQASYEAWIKHYVRDENSPNVMTDYYGHGSLVAFELDLRLRAADPDADGLDAVFRLLWQRHADTPEGYTEADVLDAIATVGDDELAALADRRVGTPGPPALGDDLLAAVGLAWEDQGGPATPELGVRASDSGEGVVLTHVLRDGPAWRAGLTGGDRLVAVGGRTVGRGQLDVTLRAHPPGEPVEVTVTRASRLLSVPVTLDTPRPRRRLTAAGNAPSAAQEAFRRWSGAAWSSI